MADINVSKVNEALCYIDTSNRIAGEISSYFSAKAPNYRFHPKYKMKLWDGTLYFFDSRNNFLPIGLLTSLKEFAKRGNYSLVFDFQIQEKIDRDEFVSFVQSLNIPFKPRDYQLLAAYQALCLKHLNISSSTASGKSLIQYIIIRWLHQHGKKSILVVPSINLVEQMFGDFVDYGWEDVEKHCSRIYGGQKRMMDRPVQISTWQSLYKDKSLFEDYDAICIDECHLASGKSLKDITQACINAEYRIGVSGSYPEERTAEWFTIVGGTGQIKTYSTYKTLQENNYIANIRINCIKLQYPDLVKRFNYNTNQKDYPTETDYVNGLPERIEFISKLAQSLTGNTLVLFTKKDKHGYPLHDFMKENLKNKSVIYMDGDTPANERERLRQLISTRNDMVIIASYGVFSTGVNSPNINNAIFASGYKSRVKVIQSMGRILRKSEGKDYASLYDIVDDLSFRDKINKISYCNHAMNHFHERQKIYTGQNFDIHYHDFVLKINNVDGKSEKKKEPSWIEENICEIPKDDI